MNNDTNDSTLATLFMRLGHARDMMMNWDTRLGAALAAGDRDAQTAARIPRDHYTDLVIDLTDQVNKHIGSTRKDTNHG